MNTDWAAVLNEADEAGRKAIAEWQPTSGDYMQVVDQRTGKVYEPFMPCGFAYVQGISGNSSLARWLRKQGQKDEWSSRWSYRTHYGSWGPGYPQGTSLYVYETGPYNTQAMEPKALYAAAFAKVLNEHGVRAYSSSRMD